MRVVLSPSCFYTPSSHGLKEEEHGQQLIVAGAKWPA